MFPFLLNKLQLKLEKAFTYATVKVKKLIKNYFITIFPTNLFTLIFSTAWNGSVATKMRSASAKLNTSTLVTDAFEPYLFLPKTLLPTTRRTNPLPSTPTTNMRKWRVGSTVVSKVEGETRLQSGWVRLEPGSIKLELVEFIGSWEMFFIVFFFKRKLNLLVLKSYTWHENIN